MSARVVRRHVARLALVALLLLATAGCQLEVGAAPATTATPPPPATAAPSPTPASASTPTLAPTAAPTPTPAAAAAPPQAAVATSGDFATAIRQVAQKVRPAVVQITNQQVQVDQFNQPFTVPAGVGSGVIYDRDGHVLTNNHVIEGADQLQVSLPDGRSFPARLVGGDAQTDLAVLQVDAKDLPVAQLGDSSKLEVGDWVVAIGNALGLPGGPTVTAGVVSALGRTVQEPSSTRGGQGPFLFDVIQTSAPINPGNSGGPLANLRGEVVGINTLVAGQAEPGVPAQGIGFAIAINTAKPIADQLVANGRVIYPYLGIRYQALNPAINLQLGLPANQGGVIIVQVVPRSPAAQAGLRRMDVVTEIDNTPLKSEWSFTQLINQHKPGDTVTLKVLRGNQTLNVRVTLGEMPPQ